MIHKSLFRATGMALALTAATWAGAPLTHLPRFKLSDLTGKTWSSAQFMGRPLVIDFWATWCHTCKETIPKLVEINEKYKDKGLTIIGISEDKSSDEKVQREAKKFGINYLVLHDKDNSFGSLFGFSGIPSLYVFNRRGELKTAMPGYDPDEEKQLDQAVQQVLH